MQIKTKNIAVMGFMTALLCVLSPIMVPMPGGIGISLGLFAILLITYLMGTIKGLICYGMYIILGAIGLPVFAGFRGGLAVITGPTGGYLIGYIAVIIIVGIFQYLGKNKMWMYILGSVLGISLCYIIGSIWFIHITETGFKQAVWICIIPYIPFDVVKIIAVCIIGPVLKKHTNKIFTES